MPRTTGSETPQRSGRAWAMSAVRTRDSKQCRFEQRNKASLLSCLVDSTMGP
jgi:hypothetical protein